MSPETCLRASGSQKPFDRQHRQHRHCEAPPNAGTGLFLLYDLHAVVSIDPVQLTGVAKTNLIGAGRHFVGEPLNRWASASANAELSITNPISVLSRAERGSKLNDPTNTRERSTANVLACRLDADEPEPERPVQSTRFLEPDDPRLSSNSVIPAARSDLRRLA